MTPPEELAGCSILLADRNSPRRRQLAETLRAAGAVVRTVGGAENIVPEVLAAELMGRPCDAVVLRVETCDRDELEAGRRLRDSGSMTPVIGLVETDSGTITEDLDRRCQATGCCACLTGTEDVSRLFQVIRGLCHPERRWTLHKPKNAPCLIRSCSRRQADGHCRVC